MFLLATSSFIQEFSYFFSIIFPKSDSAAPLSSSAKYKLFDAPIALPFAIWGADAFMVSSKTLFVSYTYLCLVDMEMLHAVPGIIRVSSLGNLSSPIVSGCGYNLYG
jgi:hypothetical protein